MKLKKGIKVFDKLFTKRIEFKVRLNLFWLLLIIFIPFAVYADYTILENSITHYIVVCCVEAILVYIGYCFGIYDKAIYDKEVK